MIHTFSVFYHYLSCALTVIVPAFGVGIGQGLTSLAALQAVDEQPVSHGEIMRTFVLAMALIETAAILSFIIGLKLALFGAHSTFENAQYIHYAQLGIMFAVALSGCASGIMSAWPARKAILSVARQPFFLNKIQLIMLVTQSIMQTPIIFALLVSLIIQNQLESVTTLTDSLRIIGSGLSLGIGSIGPVIGLGLLAQAGCKAVSVNKNIFSKIFSFTVISAALIESAVLFSFIIALYLLKPVASLAPYKGITLLAGGLAMGLSTLGVGISSGKLTAQACASFTQKPELYSVLTKSSLFSQVLIETSAIYALVISLMLINS